MQPLDQDTTDKLRLQYKNALDLLQQPLFSYRTKLSTSAEVLSRLQDGEAVLPSEDESKELEQNRQYYDTLKYEAALLEAYLNKYIFIPLAESPERVADTIDFCKFLIDRTPAKDNEHNVRNIAQQFADFFNVNIPEDYDQPATAPTYTAEEVSDIGIDSSTAHHIVENLSHRLTSQNGSHRNDADGAKGGVGVRGVTQIYYLRQASGGIGFPALEVKIRESLPKSPDKVKIIWGNVLKVLESTNRRLAVSLGNLMDAYITYEMYRLARGMISATLTDMAVRERSGPVTLTSIPVPWRTELDRFEITPVLTALKKASLPHSSPARSELVAPGDEQIIKKLTSTGVILFSSTSMTDRYFIGFRFSDRSFVYVIRWGMDSIESPKRIILEKIPSDASRDEVQLMRLFLQARGAAVVDEPVYVPLPKPSKSRGGKESSHKLTKLKEALRLTPTLSSNRSLKRIIVISGDKRDPSIEFVQRVS